ncbi:MAG: hypothetical protein ABWY45_02405 [Mycobacterium sp.]
MTVDEPFSRQSTLLQLSRTPIGRLVRWLIALHVRSAATTRDEARMFAGAAGYLTVEKMVRASGGKLTWPVADSIIDIANGQNRRVVVRVVGAGRARILR